MMLRSFAAIAMLLLATPIAFADGLVEIPFSAPWPTPSLLDVNGVSTGLTDRLPGTGGSVPLNDPNMELAPAESLLRLTSQTADLDPRNPAGRNLGAVDAPARIMEADLGRTILQAAVGFSDVSLTLGQKVGIFVGQDADNLFAFGLEGTAAGNSRYFAYQVIGGVASDVAIDTHGGMQTERPAGTDFVVNYGRGQVVDVNEWWFGYYVNGSLWPENGIGPIVFPFGTNDEVYTGAFAVDSGSAMTLQFTGMFTYSTSVPEPTTYLLGALAVFGLFAFRHSRKA